MEDKKLLANEELEKVAGGTGNENDVTRAFSNALFVFRAVKTTDDESETLGFSLTDHDRGILMNMIMECERFLSGELDANTALYYIQSLYDSLNKKDVNVQRAMDNLKTAVG